MSRMWMNPPESICGYDPTALSGHADLPAIPREVLVGNDGGDAHAADDKQTARADHHRIDPIARLQMRDGRQRLVRAAEHHGERAAVVSPLEVLAVALRPQRDIGIGHRYSGASLVSRPSVASTAIRRHSTASRLARAPEQEGVV